MKRLFFDLEPFDRWHRAEAEHVLHGAAGFAQNSRLAFSKGTADFTVGFLGASLNDPFGKLWRPPAADAFVWDQGDLPAGIQRGLYCSLPAGLADPRRHRSFTFLWRYNECLRPYDTGEATRLFSFVGSLSSGLRVRMARVHSAMRAAPESEFRITQGSWETMFDRSGTPAKRDYAESMRRAKFILCPRGNGVGSVRLFEAMEAQRVPVILSDRYWYPQDVDWSLCSISVKERDLPRITEILRRAEPQWETLARNARREWERRFSPEHLLDEVARLLGELTGPAGPLAKVRLGAAYANLHLRRTIPAIIARLRPRRQP